MKSREIAFLVGGLVTGLVVSFILLSSPELRLSLFGTAGLVPGSTPAYYLVDMDTTEQWLTELYPTEDEIIATAMERLNTLTTTETFSETIRETQPDMDYILARSYAALTGVDPTFERALPNMPAVELPEIAQADRPSPLFTSTSDGDFSACLGIDENPYNVNGYALYMYYQIPSSQAANMPSSWTALELPKDDDLYWQRLACQSLIANATTGRR